MKHESWGAWDQGGSRNRKYLNRISKSGKKEHHSFPSRICGIKERGREIRAILEYEYWTSRKRLMSVSEIENCIKEWKITSLVSKYEFHSEPSGGNTVEYNELDLEFLRKVKLGNEMLESYT